MKQVNPGESSEPVKLPSPAPEAVQSPQQALNNYTATQTAPAESVPVPQPSAPVPQPPPTPVEEVKPEVAKAAPAPAKPEAAAKPEVVSKPEPAVKPEVPKEIKPSAKPAEVKPSEAAKAEVVSDSAKPVKPAKAAEETAKINDTKAAPKPDEKPKMKQEKTADAPVGIAASSRRLSKMDENAYVLQIMVTNSAKKVEDILAGAPNKKDLAAYKTTRDGKEVFIVVEGEYPNANAAAAAAKNLPSMQQSAKPWPKKVGLIHAEIKSP